MSTKYKVQYRSVHGWRTDSTWTTYESAIAGAGGLAGRISCGRFRVRAKESGGKWATIAKLKPAWGIRQGDG